MSINASCAKCGAELYGFATEGFCSACLLERGLSHEATAPAPLSRFGDYELIEEIARGGMGVVYRARQLSLNRIVAIKMILSGQFASAAETQRFRAEATAAAALQHPGIVAIHEIGEHDGLLFFSMGYVEGHNLAQLIRDGPWSGRRAAQCVRDIAVAIHYAHEHGVLHRDLKPSNVLIDAEGKPRVTDFGLAKRLSNSEFETQNSELTLSGQVLGSPNFMPPEQAAGKHRELTAASDVYSLGALLYHLLTGRPPFLAESVAATLRLVSESDPVAPRLLSPAVPRDLETICLKCLDKEARRRYATARELAEELARFLRDEPIHARPLGRSARFVLWTRRHPVVAALSAVIALLLLSVAVISTTMATRLQRANNEGREKLRESFLAQARATRWSGRPGRRFDSLEALRKAAEIRPGIDLRNEAIAAMALVDIHRIKSWEISRGTIFGFNESYDRYMRAPTNGPITLHRVKDDQELARHSPPASFQWAHLSAGGNLFSIYSTNPPRLDVFRWGGATPVLSLTNLYIRSHQFSADDRTVAVGVVALDKPRYRVFVLDVSTGRTNVEIAAHTLPSVSFGPGLSKLAVFGNESVELKIHETSSGEVLQTLPHRDGISSVVWSDVGQKMATACGDGNVYLWDATMKDPAPIKLRHGGVVTTVYFSPGGELLASRGWNDQLRLWEVRSGREILRQPASALLPFSPDGGHLAIWPSQNQVNLCAVAEAREVKVWHSGGAIQCDFTPDGRLIASAHADGIRFWERASGREIGWLSEANVHSLLFSRNGNALFTASASGVRRWSLAQHERGTTNILSLVMSGLLCDGTRLHGMSVDHAGRKLAVSRDAWIEVYDCDTGKSLFSRSRQEHIASNLVNPALSPDGEWLAAWEWSGGGAHVWRLSENDRGRLIAPEAGSVTFSPDGRWLVAATPSAFTFFETGTWRRDRNFSRPVSAEFTTWALFSPDETTFALRLNERSIGLYDFASGGQLATLESPGDARLGSGVFSPDGHLLAVPDKESGGIIIWDLAAVRARLNELGLDWDSPRAPSRPPAILAEWKLNVSKAPVAARDPQCTERQIDLAPHYNANFHNFSRFTGEADNNLSSLPSGLRTLHGVDFDLRGVVQLLGFTKHGLAPQAITGIEVGQSCRRLHFLHSASVLTGRQVPAYKTVFEYIIRWTDGKKARVPVKNQVNVADWWCCSVPHQFDTNTTMVGWKGTNAASARLGHEIQLYKFRWENPRPEIPIASIDVEAMDAAPFLIAITAE